MSDRLRAVVLRATPQQLAEFAKHLDPDDLAELEAIAAEIDADRHQQREAIEQANVPWRQNPALMAHHLEGDAFKLYPHVSYLGHKYRQLETGEDRYQIWFLPPQYFKSSIAQRGIAWSLDRKPHLSYITTSYGDDLAERNGIFVRDYLIEHGDQLRVRLKRDVKRANRFLTDEGGGLLATGQFSTMTGFPATGGIVVDDPIKNWQDAHSGTKRRAVMDNFKTGVWTRRSHGDVWVLMIMTAWHESDIGQELANSLDDEFGVTFSVTRLPEIAEAPDPASTKRTLRLVDPLGRAPGDLLCPERFDRKAVDAKHRMLGTYLASGLLQQRPAPAAGTEILREWFQLAETVPGKPDRAISSWDMKLKDTQSGDYVVGQCWWRVGGAYWLMDQLRGQWNQAETKAAMALMAVRHPEIVMHFFENTGNAPEVVAELRAGNSDYSMRTEVGDRLGMTDAEREAVQQLLRRGMESLNPVTPIADKSVRMRAVSPKIEGGNVFLPAYAPWVPGLLDEMAAFPNGTNDDQVDACSQALAKLAMSDAKLSGKSEGQVRANASRGVAGRPQGRVGGFSRGVPGRG